MLRRGLAISKQVLAVIPAYNEETKIAATIKGLKQVDSITGIVVIDDGSTDKTVSIAEELDVQVIKMEQNVGKGTALKRAFASLDSHVMVLIDADIGESAKDAHKLVSALEDEQADMVIGILPPSKKRGGLGFARGFAAWCIKTKTGCIMTAPLSGQRAILKSAMKPRYLKNGFGLEVGLTIGFLKDQKKVIEVPVNFEHTGTGKDIMGFIHRGRQFYDIFRAVWLRG